MKLISLTSLSSYALGFLAVSILLLFQCCTYTQRIKDGSMAFERKQYSVAVEMLKSEFSKSKSRVERGKIAFMLAESLQYLGENETSIDWFKKAYDNQFGDKALQGYAFALKQDEQYDEAAKAFKELGIETGDPITYRKEISACEVARVWKETPNEERAFDVEISDFNSSASDYAPVYLASDEIIFTSDRGEASGESIYNWTGREFSDLFRYSNGKISVMDGPFNSKDNDGTISFNRDRNYAVFTRCYQREGEDSYCILMESSLINDSWTEPQELPFIEANVNYGQPAVNAGGDVIYFASDHPDGWGGFDLYKVMKIADEWNEPVILPLRLNTIEDEQFPFLQLDTLYFSSTGHGGMGGLDIYKTYKRPNGTWAPVQNLKYPINSGGDDFGFAIQTTSLPGKIAEGFFSSNRKDGAGNDDIYAFIEKVPVIPETAVVEVEVDSSEIISKTKKEIIYKIIGHVISDEYKDINDPSTIVEGATTDVANAQVTITTTDETIDVKGNENGYFEQVISTDGNYDFLVSADGYLTNTAQLSVQFDEEDISSSEQLFRLKVKLDRIFKDVEINLENIYYDLDKWDIRTDAEPTLLELVKNLNLNPNIRIQLSSHTDCRGDDPYNEWLSQKRAQSAVDFLISQGIDASRLEAKGYGESIPFDPCVCNQCSEEQHQANRRTTFKIIE
ncbi:MAG: OmpA family protein [Bacteroidia bacterium]|nr:OmpA family protein [Bacteroidia bacterium]